MEKGQSAGNIGVLVFLIAIFLALFILLLPPEDRENLLRANTSVDSNRDSSNVALLSQAPGLLNTASADESLHKINPINLFLRDEPLVSDLASRLTLTEGTFSSDARKLTFKIEDTDDLENAYLIFSAEKSEGNLIITLNEAEIFAGKSEGLQTVVLPKNLLQEINSLDFEVSSPGINIFKENEYILKDVKVRQSFEIINTKEKRTFVLSAAEKGNGKLSYFLFCNNAAESSRLRVFLNKEEISNELITCGSADKEVDINAADLEEGTNELIFEIDKGDYLIKDIELRVKTSEGGTAKYKFGVSGSTFDKINIDNRKVELKIIFDDNDRKKFVYEINNNEFSVDIEDDEFKVEDVGEFIEEGNNIFKIIPQSEFTVDKLELILK